MWLTVFNRLREKSGLSLDDLSERSGVPKSTLSKITAGITKSPSIETIKSLVYAMGYTLADLDENAVQEFSQEEFAHIKKYRVLDTHGKRVVDHVLDDEYDRMTHIESREEKGSITYITLYDLAVSAGTGEPLGDTYYSTKLEIPTEEVPEEAESVPSEAELLLPPQPASMEAHSVRANMAEKTFFMVMTFLLFFLENVLLGYLTAYMINTQCKVREGGKVKSV